MQQQRTLIWAVWLVTLSCTRFKSDSCWFGWFVVLRNLTLNQPLKNLRMIYWPETCSLPCLGSPVWLSLWSNSQLQCLVRGTEYPLTLLRLQAREGLGCKERACWLVLHPVRMMSSCPVWAQGWLVRAEEGCKTWCNWEGDLGGDFESCTNLSSLFHLVLCPVLKWSCIQIQESWGW